MRLLVAGGNGFIGRHIVRRGVQSGWEVTSLSLRPTSWAEHVGVRHCVADLTDGASLRHSLGAGSFEYVVNCGGYIDHASLAGGGRRVLDGHFMGALNLIEALDRTALRSYVQFGSSDEYGGAPAPQIETQREAPISLYSAAKVATSHLLQMLFRAESFPATTLRLFLTYGPGQDDRRFLPQIIKACLENRPFPTSAGEQLRDFCFVENTVDALFATFENAGARGEIVNIGSGRPVAIRDVIQLVRHLTGGGVPQFGEIPYRLGENMALYADVSKARALLGWVPATTLEHGLRQTIEWVRDQQL